jgi:hypothetical protein
VKHVYAALRVDFKIITKKKNEEEEPKKGKERDRGIWMA